MDLATIMDGFSHLVTALCGALLVYGGWLSLGQALDQSPNKAWAALAMTMSGPACMTKGCAKDISKA